MHDAEAHGPRQLGGITTHSEGLGVKRKKGTIADDHSNRIGQFDALLTGPSAHELHSLHDSSCTPSSLLDVSIAVTQQMHCDCQRSLKAEWGTSQWSGPLYRVGESEAKKCSELCSSEMERLGILRGEVRASSMHVAQCTR